jgi:hypothetical protein
MKSDGVRVNGVRGFASIVSTALTGVLLALTPQAQAVTATGGSMTHYVENGTNYTAHIFTSSDTFTVANGGIVEYLVVGGGAAVGMRSAAGPLAVAAVAAF